MEWRDHAAQRVARELLVEPGQFRLAKASSLLHAFRSPGTHTDLGEMKRALRVQGVNARPRGRRTEISHRHVIELVQDESIAAEPARPTSYDGIRISRWRPGAAGRDEFSLESYDRGERWADEVQWFDVDPLDSDPTPEVIRHRVEAVTEQLKPLCPELEDIMVRDLLTVDVQPKIETYGDERSGVRSVSVAAMVALEIPDDDDFDGVDEQLVIQLVELVVGPGWIITCWHRCRTLVGSGEVQVGPSLLREPFMSHVAHRWENDRPEDDGSELPKHSGDLGLYLARSLVATYGASLRMLQGWVSSWEVRFYKTLGGQDNRENLQGEAVEISSFLSMVGEFSRNVSAFKLAGEEMSNKTWFADLGQRTAAANDENFPDVQAEVLASSVETATRKLAHLSDEIRADMDLLMIQSQARQQQTSERLQGYLGKVTGLVLVPTFVAGLFGANTALPGGGTWMGFEIMLVLMALSAAVSYYFIRNLIK